MKYIAIIAAAALVLLALLTGTGVTSQSDGRITFDHSLHVSTVGVECAQCHAAANTAESAKTRLIPGMDVCASCHDVETESGCVMCHADPANIVAAPIPGAGYETFSHKLHTAKLACGKCHAVQAGTVEKGDKLPKMAECTTCHAQNQVNAACVQCHAEKSPAMPVTHYIGWQKRHGDEARFARNDCAMCHEAPGAKTTCSQCHQGGEFGTPHPRNFVHSTAFLRGGGFADCQSCHEPESFCASCHQQKRVMPANHSMPGWATTITSPTKGGTHARKGEADLESCVICHASRIQQPTCFSAGCHQ